MDVKTLWLLISIAKLPFKELCYSLNGFPYTYSDVYLIAYAQTCISLKTIPLLSFYTTLITFFKDTLNLNGDGPSSLF